MVQNVKKARLIVLVVKILHTILKNPKKKNKNKKKMRNKLIRKKNRVVLIAITRTQLCQNKNLVWNRLNLKFTGNIKTGKLIV